MLLFFIGVAFLHNVAVVCGEETVFRFAKHYGDHMVLPAHPKKAVIWGFGEKGRLVHILYQGTPYLTTVDQETGGLPSWSFVLPSNYAGGPYSIVVSSKAGSKLYALMLKDVLFGDLWLCGGQSNMQFTVGQASSAEEEFNISGNYENIRLLSVARKTSEVPLYDLPAGGIDEPWTLPSKEALFRPTWAYFSAVCWMFGRRLYDKFKRPIGLISSNWGGTPIEAWSSPDVLKKCGVENIAFRPTRNFTDEVHGPQKASILWNGMIHPFLHNSLFGVIWYQGEQNAYHPEHYHCLFPAMIADWRKKWYIGTKGRSDPEFPFGFVQLAPRGTDRKVIAGFPTIRFSQTALYGYVPNKAMPNTFMSVAMDLPDLSSPYGNIHPRDKKDVADRLLLSALSVVYKEKVRWTGPLVQDIFVRHMTSNYHEILLNYQPASIAAGGLDVRSKEGFEVLIQTGTQSGVWKPVDIFMHQNNTVIFFVAVAQGSKLKAMRYAWSDYPCLFKACAIYEKDSGLPAPTWTLSLPYKYTDLPSAQFDLE